MLHLLWTPNVNLRFSFYSWLQASDNSNWNIVTCQPAWIIREFPRISFATRISVNFREETRSFAKCWAWRSTLNLQSAGQQGSQAGRAELAEIAVELARETDGARDARQARGHEMVEVAVCRGRQLQRSEAYVIPKIARNHYRAPTSNELLKEKKQ